LGKAIAGRRNRVVICTKVTASHKPQEDESEIKPRRFTQHFLLQQAERSLERLGTSYIDLYLLRQPDKVTPAVEIIEAMETLVKAGKIRYGGVSNHRATQVNEYVELGRITNKPSIAGIEDYYNIAGESLNEAGDSRMHELEKEMIPLLRRTGLGFIAFSPMDMGYLAAESQVNPGTPLAALKRCWMK